MQDDVATPGARDDHGTLSAELEAEVYAVCFGSNPDLALRELADRHPPHAPAILALGASVARAGGLVTHLHHALSTLGLHAPITSPSTPPPTCIGPYRVVRELGRGGFGIVYLAEQAEPLPRRVAIKLLRCGTASGEVLQRFTGERKAMASLDHPGIAHIYEAAETPAGEPYFAMEYIDGQPITDWCRARRLPVAERLRLFLDVCQAVVHAHQRGVLHRDLKPANILVVGNDGAPQPKIIDFGLAKALQTESDLSAAVGTVEGRLLGTPEYMAPEQAAGRNVDTRADIYSLGVILFELLAGRLPLSSETLRQDGIASVVRTLDESPPPRLSSTIGQATDAADFGGSTPGSLRRLLRGDLDTIVGHCLQKHPDQRYQGVAELAADLRRHLANEPIAVRPPGLGYVLGRLARRHQATAAAAAIVIVALLAAIAVTSWSLWRVLDARDEANAAAELARWRAYVGTIAAADGAGSAGRGAEMRQRLDAAPDDLRGLEWHILDAQADDSLARIPTGLRRGIGLAAVGAAFLLADIDDDLLRCGQAMGARPEVVPVNAEVLQIAGDGSGRRAIASFADSTARVFAASGDPVIVTLPQPTEALALATDGNWFAHAHADDVVIRALPGGEERQRLVGCRDGIPAMAIADDGRLLAAGDGLGTVHVWRLSTGERLTSLAHPSPRRRLAFTAGGTRLVTAGHDNVLRMFDCATGVLAAEQATVTSAICAMATDVGGRLVVTGDAEGVVRYWDGGTLRDLGAARGHHAYVNSITHLADGRFASFAWDGDLRVWPASPPERNAAWSGIDGNAARLVRHPRDPIAFVGTLAGQVGAFTLPDGDPKWVRTVGPMVHGMACTQGGRRLLVTCWDGFVRILDPADGTPMGEHRVARTGALGNLLILDRRDEVVTCDQAAVLRLDPAGLSARGSLPLTSDNEPVPLAELAASRDQRLVAACSDAGLHVFDLDAGVESWNRLGHPVRAVFAPDADLLYAAVDGHLLVLDAHTGAERRRFGHGPDRPMLSVAVTPDGERLLIADQHLRIWGTRRGDELLVLPGRRYLPHAVLLAADQGLLLTGGGHFFGSAELLAWPLRPGVRGRP